MRAVLVAAVALVLAPPAGAAETRVSFADRTVLFGAPTTAEVIVVAGHGEDADEIRIESSFAPFRVLDRSTERRGGMLLERTRIICAADTCRPRAELLSVQLPPVRVTVPGRPATQTAWPRLLVASRVPAEAAAREPQWRVDTVPPAVTSRFRPSALATVLWLAAAALTLASLGLLARELVRRRRPPAQLDDLEAALAAVRAAVGADVPERRRATGVLARALRRRRDRRSAAAAALAWDEPEPEPERLAKLADEVEREVRA